MVSDFDGIPWVVFDFLMELNGMRLFAAAIPQLEILDSSIAFPLTLRSGQPPLLSAIY